MKTGKTVRIILLLALCLALSGCRVRTGAGGAGRPEGDAGIPAAAPSPGVPGEPEADSGDEQEKNGEPGGRTKENPEASRKEYDEDRPAEIVPGTERTVHGSGEGGGLSASGEGVEQAASKLAEDAEKTAVRTVPAEEAERKGVSGDAEEADSAMTYFSVLLKERTDSLFECQRLNLYWETKEDHETVFRKSPEHSLILDAGAYDVSARLLEQNLRVDDGWIGRKNPGVIVKVTDRSVLGTGTVSDGAARGIYESLLARDGWTAIDAVRNGRVLLLSEEMLEAPYLRLAATLLIAKTAAPEQFADVDAGKALEMLQEEAAGTVSSGIYYYNGQGGF